MKNSSSNNPVHTVYIIYYTLLTNWYFVVPFFMTFTFCFIELKTIWLIIIPNTCSYTWLDIYAMEIPGQWLHSLISLFFLGSFKKGIILLLFLKLRAALTKQKKEAFYVAAINFWRKSLVTRMNISDIKKILKIIVKTIMLIPLPSWQIPVQRQQ